MSHVRFSVKSASAKYSHENRFFSSRTPSCIAAARSFSKKSRIAAAIAPASGATVYPETPSLTISGKPPTFVTIIGFSK